MNDLPGSIEQGTPPIKESVALKPADQSNDENRILSLRDIAEGKPEQPVSPQQSKESSFFFNIEEAPEGFKVTMPGGITESGGIVSAYSKMAGSREEAEQMLQNARDDLGPSVELMSLRKSFSPFHSIQREDGKYSVTFPGFRSLDKQSLLAGTSKMSFDTWEEAKNFYLENRNNREYPEEAVFELKIDDVDYKFSHLNKFGQRLHLSDQPLDVSEETKTVLDFDARNAPNSEHALTYARTLEASGWQPQVFRFIENFTQTPEGQQLVSQLGIEDLRLLTPQQAAKLTLEVVTRLKKYNLDEMNATELTESDQNNALVLLQEGLVHRDDADYKGNGICRNFASTVKAVFESLKANQTKFNYLQNTYAFYESGPRADFDPTYKAPNMNAGISLNVDRSAGPGHAWNSFVTVEESGVSQTVVDATWSNFDYDTQESVKLDYTLQRMEKDVYRNLKRKDAQVDADQAAQFYVFLLDSLPQQDGLVLDEETTARARASELYKSIDGIIRSKNDQLSREQYDEDALKWYKKLVDDHSLKTKTQFYLGRAIEVVRGREGAISQGTATEITRLVAEVKQDVDYFDIISVYRLPTQRAEDRSAAVGKYVTAWETASEKGYIPIRDLVFRGNNEIQGAVLQACTPKTRELLSRELLLLERH